MTDKYTPNVLPEEFKNWTGSFEDLVSTSTQLLAQLTPEVSAPSASVIRYYQQQGVVGRGITRGRTKVFTAAELEQVITAKQMAGQKVPLSLVRSAYETQPAKATTAQNLVADMMKRAGLSQTYATNSVLPKQTYRAAFQPPKPVDPGLIEQAQALIGSSGPQLDNLLNDVFKSQATQYVSLPTGGTARYTLSEGVSVELSTNGDIQAQAQALHNFADQLLAGNSTTK